jgi:hypothetical protein
MTGMDANAVLSEEQRQIRFRKVIERKNGQPDRRSSGTRSETASEELRLRRPSRSTLFPPLVDKQQVQQQQHHEVQHEQQQQGVDEVRINKWAKILQPKVDMIVQNYRTVQNHLNLMSKLFETLNLVLENHSNVDAIKREILSYVSVVSQEFRHFANMFRLVGTISNTGYFKHCLLSLLHNYHISKF